MEFLAASKKYPLEKLTVKTLAAIGSLQLEEEEEQKSARAAKHGIQRRDYSTRKNLIGVRPAIERDAEELNVN